MRKIILVFVLVVPTFLFGKLKEIIQDKAERMLYVEDLKYGTPEKRWEAAEILGDAGDCFAVPYLIKALKDEDTKVREYVAEALGKLKDKKAKGPLKKRLKDPYASVRYAAGESLARMRDKAGVPIIVQGLRDTTARYHRRARIAQALGILGERSAIPALLSVIADPVSPRVREQATLALGVLGSREAVEPICKRILGVEEDVPCRVAITVALADIGDKPRSIPSLVRALKDPNARVRNGASEALKILVDKDRKTIPILLELLEPEDTREYATVTLDSFFGEFDRDRDLPLLAKVVGSAGPQKRTARLYAIEVLEKLGDKRGVQPLVEALEDADSIIRARSAAALGKLGYEEAVPPLIDYIDDPSVMAAKCIIIALGDIGDPLCDTTLFRVVNDKIKPWKLRVVAATSIGHLPSKVVYGRLFKQARHPDGDLRYLAYVSYGELKDKEALVTLDYSAIHEVYTRNRDAARIAAAKIREKAFGGEYK